ncbi:MAG TPA: alpha/beta hydrolase [Myxococcales bacterium]
MPQWISVRGPQSASAPVLLFLHGGPGGAEYGPRRKYLRSLEQDWLVVDWDQRGAGRSFRGDETASTLSLDRLVDDANELVGWLCRETGREKVTVVGHSFGTVLGVLLAQRAPERLAAYVGTAQVVNWALQEERSYDWTLAEARRRGHSKAVAALETLGRPAQGAYAVGVSGVEVQRRWLGTFGGVSADPRFLMRWALSILTCGSYPLRAKLRFTKGMARSMELIWPELGRRIDFARDVPRLDVPVFVFAGRTDHITDLAQIEGWFAALQAPAKRLEIVDQAGHLNLFEAPERFRAFLESTRQ